MTRAARLLGALGLLGGFAGHGAIEAVRWWTPAMPADLRGFIVAMLVAAVIATAIQAALER